MESKEELKTIIKYIDSDDIELCKLGIQLFYDSEVYKIIENKDMIKEFGLEEYYDHCLPYNKRTTVKPLIWILKDSKDFVLQGTYSGVNCGIIMMLKTVIRNYYD